jgi:chromosome segregation ATPase
VGELVEGIEEGEPGDGIYRGARHGTLFAGKGRTGTYITAVRRVEPAPIPMAESNEKLTAFQRIKGVERERDEARAEYEELLNRYEKLSDDKSELLRKSFAAVDPMMQLVADLNTERHKHAETMARCESLTRDAATAAIIRERLEAVYKERDELRSKVSELERAAKERIAGLEAQLETMGNALQSTEDSAHTEVTRLHEQVSARDSEIARLREELAGNVRVSATDQDMVCGGCLGCGKSVNP